MLDRIFLSNSYSYRNKKCVAVIVFIAIYLLIPTIVTLNVTGVVYTPVNEDYSDGRKVIVKYRNATQEVSVDRFVAMVLAKRLYMSSEVEVLKAESIMIRTDVYRLMGEQMIIDSSELGMEYMTTQQMGRITRIIIILLRTARLRQVDLQSGITISILRQDIHI